MRTSFSNNSSLSLRTFLISVVSCNRKRFNVGDQHNIDVGERERSEDQEEELRGQLQGAASQQVSLEPRLGFDSARPRS